MLWRNYFRREWALGPLGRPHSAYWRKVGHGSAHPKGWAALLGFACLLIAGSSHAALGGEDLTELERLRNRVSQLESKLGPEGAPAARDSGNRATSKKSSRGSRAVVAASARPSRKTTQPAVRPQPTETELERWLRLRGGKQLKVGGKARKRPSEAARSKTRTPPHAPSGV